MTGLDLTPAMLALALDSIPNVGRALGEVRRVLCPGGNMERVVARTPVLPGGQHGERSMR